MIVEAATNAPVQHAINCSWLQDFFVETGGGYKGLYHPVVRKAIPGDFGPSSEEYGSRNTVRETA